MNAPQDITFTVEVQLITGETTYTLTGDDIVELSVTVDKAWTPAVQASMTLIIDPALADKVDPTSAVVTPRARILMSRGDQQRQWDLRVRRVVASHVSGTLSVDAMSAERDVDMLPWTSLTGWDPAPETYLVPIAEDILALAGHQMSPSAPPAVFEFDDPPTWELGATAGDYLRSLCDVAGFKLIEDGESDGFMILGPDAVIGPGPTRPRLYRLEDLIELDQGCDLDGTYADDVLVVYRWTDDNGVSRINRDLSTPSGAERPTWHIERSSTPYPGPGAADPIKDRLNAWRRQRTVRLLWDLDLRPGIVLAVQETEHTITTGRVHAVTYREDGTMTATAAYDEWDTGSQIVPLQDLWESFDLYYPSLPVRWRRVGKTVELWGYVAPNNATTASNISSDTGARVLTLPPEIVPTTARRSFVQQGDTGDTWCLTLEVGDGTGQARVTRYSGTAEIGTYLGFSAMWFIE